MTLAEQPPGFEPGMQDEQECRWQERLEDLGFVHEYGAIESPMIEVDGPNGNTLHIKLEKDQEIGSFKIRGALIAIGKHGDEMPNGVIADSGGNHAQAVAFAANKLHRRAKVRMPGTLVSQAKQDATRKFGGDYLVLDTSPKDFVTSKAETKKEAADSGMYYLSPYDNEWVAQGTATIATEIYQQLGRWPDAVHVPIGGGGLISGIADVVAECSLKTRVVGSGLKDAADSGAKTFEAIKSAHEAGEALPEKPVEIESPDAIVEGLSVKVVGDTLFKRMLAGKIHDVYSAEDLAELGAAYAWYAENVLPALGVDTTDEEAVWQNLPELSSMVAVASALKAVHDPAVQNEEHVVVISGGNIDRTKAGKAMDAYRLVA